MLKISQNKSLSKTDKASALKSVRSLSKTIEDLINREKLKLSDMMESKVASQTM